MMAAVAVLGAALLMGGCSVVNPMPSYESVRTDTITSAQEVIKTFPPSATVVQRPDSTPYPCSTGSPNTGGYLYTGEWNITLPDGSDVATLINALPESAGQNWQVSKGSLPRSNSYVDITDSARNVEMAITDTSASANAPTINIVALSVCADKPRSY